MSAREFGMRLLTKPSQTPCPEILSSLFYMVSAEGIELQPTD